MCKFESFATITGAASAASRQHQLVGAACHYWLQYLYHPERWEERQWVGEDKSGC